MQKAYVLLEHDGCVAAALEEHLRRSGANRYTESFSEILYGERRGSGRTAARPSDDGAVRGADRVEVVRRRALERREEAEVGGGDGHEGKEEQRGAHGGGASVAHVTRCRAASPIQQRPPHAHICVRVAPNCAFFERVALARMRCVRCDSVLFIDTHTQPQHSAYALRRCLILTQSYYSDTHTHSRSPLRRPGRPP